MMTRQNKMMKEKEAEFQQTIKKVDTTKYDDERKRIRISTNYKRVDTRK